MRIHLQDRDAWLTYCTNVHPAESLEGIERSLDEVAVAVRRRLGSAPFGLGLWLARAVVDELEEPSRLQRFRAFLAARDLYPFTLNAFPYGGFHAGRVKERVFQPAWDREERLQYTVACAHVLAQLLPPGVEGSISSVPLGHPGVGVDRTRAIENLRAAAGALAAIERGGGPRIVLALEPEPAACLETVEQGARFLDEQVFEGRGDPCRRHLGLCLDTCHEAVMHQDLGAALRSIRARGVVLGKVQVTSALRLRRPAERAGRERLAAFDEGRYFHQAAARGADGVLRVFPDLAPFLEAATQPGMELVEEARIHFHVPVFAEPQGALSTTRAEVADFLRLAAGAAEITHFEVETYTFDVIPAAERAALGAASLPDLLARELQWTLHSLGALPPE